MSKGLARVLVAIALVVAIGLAFLFRDRLDPAALEAWVAGAGAAGPLLFIVIYALATVLFLPGAALTLVGGALFGPVAGTLYNLTGATIGAVIAFLAARHLAADWVRDRAGPRLDGIMGGVETEGWRFVAFTRLVPLFPFNLLKSSTPTSAMPGARPWPAARACCRRGSSRCRCSGRWRSCRGSSHVCGPARCSASRS